MMNNKERNLRLQAWCKHCKKLFYFMVNDEDFLEYMTGEKLVQEAFPYLTAGERELLLNQMCEDCWNKMFADIADLSFVTVGKGVE